MLNPRLLVVSIGNPLPRYESLHSAGHFVLNGLVKVLEQPAFRQVRLGGWAEACPVSEGPKYTLVQSPTYMNTSGPFVEYAWKNMLKRHSPASASLVLVHDELERELGVSELKPWSRSPKGHNGVSSAKRHLSQDKNPLSPLARIAVGIGRPVERDAATVSKYVLDRISAGDRRALEGQVPFDVLTNLDRLEAIWRAEAQAGSQPGLTWAASVSTEQATKSVTVRNPNIFS